MTVWGTWDLENIKRCDCNEHCTHTPVIDQWSVKLSDGNFYQGKTKKELIGLFVSLTEKKSKRYLLYAHNSSAYDILFLINSFIKSINLRF